MSALASARADFDDLAPLLRRTVGLDPAALVRLRRGAGTASALVRLPFGVLAARTIALEPTATSAASPAAPEAGEWDVTVGAADALAWLDGERHDPPAARDAEWRGGRPPERGWTRIDTVPERQIRDLVRSGALALRQAAEREGVPGAQPRAEVADALLDSVVLTVSGAAGSTPVTLRTISAVTRLGFLPHESYVAVDVAGRWSRVAAAYGSVFAERPGSGLLVRPAGR